MARGRQHGLGCFTVQRLYRGSWCPYCNAQLAAFSRALGPFTGLGVTVAALSAGDEETSAALAAKHKLGFPVGHSADAGKVAAATGAYINQDRTTCNRPASSWRRTGRCGSPCTHARPSGGSPPTTSPATPAT